MYILCQEGGGGCTILYNMVGACVILNKVVLPQTNRCIRCVLANSHVFPLEQQIVVRTQP